MISEAKKEQLMIELNKCSEYNVQDLLENTKWGELNFLPAKDNIEQIKNIIDQFKTLRFELLPNERIVTEIATIVKKINNLFANIITFSAGTTNAFNERQSYINNASQFYEELFTNTFQYIPYLAFKRGDIERNISMMTATVQEAKDTTSQLVKDAESGLLEINGFVEASRVAAITAGIGSFTKDFLTEAEFHKKSAKKWLNTTIGFSITTLLTAIVFCFMSLFLTYESTKVAQIVTSKITIIVIMITTTLWTAKLYKTAIHLFVVNKHKANALQTFLAFSQASDDAQTKNAVLIEATHCIFSNVNTGLTNSENGGDSIKYLEVFKNIAEKH